MKFDPIILCFHSVTNNVALRTGVEPLSTINFENILKYLHNNFHVVPIDEILRDRHQNTIAITFDDGYQNNVEIVSDLLIKYNFPASFFISTFYSENNLLYYWETVPYLIKLRKYDLFKDFFSVDNIDSLSFSEIINLVSNLPLNDLDLFIRISTEILECTNLYSEIHKPMNLTDILNLSDNLLFEIGSHTHYHSNLSTRSFSESHQDFVTAFNFIKGLEINFSNYFPIPFGKRENFSFDFVNEINKTYQTTCFSTISKTLKMYQSDQLIIPRLSVQNWDVSKFEYILKQINFFSKSNFRNHVFEHLLNLRKSINRS